MSKIGKSVLKKKTSERKPTKKEMEAMAMARAMLEQEKQKKKRSSPYTYQRPPTSTERAEQFVEVSPLGDSIRAGEKLKEFAKERGVSLTMAKELKRRELQKKRERY